MEICPWGMNSLRVREVPMGDVRDDEWALLPAETTAVTIQIAEEWATITCGNLTARIDVDPWRKRGRITYTNQHGVVLLQEISSGGALDQTPRHFHALRGGDYRLTVSFEGEADEHLFGMGQYQQETLNLQHCTLELAQRNSQASVPFVVSNKGYGFLWHNPAIGQATFAKNRKIWQAESTKQLDYWITAGDTPAQISLAYAKATGFSPMMPEYGLGFWQCKLRYWNQKQLLDVAREYKQRGLPIDLIVCDFFHWPKMGDFRFEDEFFPNPSAMINELNSMGIELMVSVWPQIALDSENYEEMSRLGLLAKSERGQQIGMRFVADSMFFDATNRRAREYVWQKCRENYFRHGIRVFWLDEAEPEWSCSYDFDNYRYDMGSCLQVGNIYPQQYSRGFYEGLRHENIADPVNLVRCAWAGSQRYGALVWSGDVASTWEAFRAQLCAGLNMGMAGIPWWTTDIGGFHGGNPDDPAFRELLIRWFQWGAFCPVMRLHGDRQPHHDVFRSDGSQALSSGADNEVWSYGEEAYEILKTYLNLRETMRVYIRSVMKETHETGKPVMRSMYYEFPNDGECLNLADQYMFGSQYLVAPVLWPDVRERKVYLPSGSGWKHLYSAQYFEGGQEIIVSAPLEEIPVFERV